MKFSSLSLIATKISSAMMGISANAQDYVGAIGSNNNADAPNSFWNTLLTILLSTAKDLLIKFWETVVSIAYLIGKWLLTIIDFIFIFIREIIGLNGEYTTIEEMTESDLIFQFVFSDTVIDVIKGMLGFAIALLILFSIFAIIKSEYEYIAHGANNSKKHVMVGALKALFLMVLVPIISIGGLMMSSAILKSLYIATAGGTDISIGSQIFMASGYNANAYRRYAQNNMKIPITFNFDEINETDNVNNWGADDAGVGELDEALRDFKGSSVWNRGYSTFLMFYNDEFLNMDTVDDLNEFYRYDDEGKVSSYHATYDRGIYTKKGEYMVMADVIEYSLKHKASLYFKTAEEVFMSYYNIRNSSAPAAVKSQIEPSIPIAYNSSSETYDFTVHFAGEENPTEYKHKEGSTDEAKGAVFLIALERQIEHDDIVYTYYYPLISSNNGFTTEEYAKDNQLVIAKGLFEEGENPTALKVEDGIVKCYRDDLNIPTLVDFFPTISYEKPEGVTENPALVIIKAGVQAVTGVDLSAFIPYVYYSFDIFNLFTKTSSNIVKLDGGRLFVDYNFQQAGVDINNCYKMADFGIVILVFASVMIMGMLIKFLFGVALRVFDIVVLAISYPAVLSTFPLDNGSRFKGWTELFITKILGIYGLVLGINLSLILFPIIDNLNLLTPSMIREAIAIKFLPSGITAMFLNELVSLLFMLVAFTAIERFGLIIESIITNKKPNDKNLGGVMADGEKVVKDLKKMPKLVANVATSIVTGKFATDAAEKAADIASKFIPGGAAIKAIKEKKEFIKEQSEAGGFKMVGELIGMAGKNSFDEIEDATKDLRPNSNPEQSNGEAPQSPQNGPQPPQNGPANGPQPPQGGPDNSPQPPQGGPDNSPQPPQGGQGNASQPQQNEPQEAPESPSGGETNEGEESKPVSQEPNESVEATNVGGNDEDISLENSSEEADESSEAMLENPIMEEDSQEETGEEESEDEEGEKMSSKKKSSKDSIGDPNYSEEQMEESAQMAQDLSKGRVFKVAKDAFESGMNDIASDVSKAKDKIFKNKRGVNKDINEDD